MPEEFYFSDSSLLPNLETYDIVQALKSGKVQFGKVVLFVSKAKLNVY